MLIFLLLFVVQAFGMNWWPYEVFELASRDNTLYWAEDPDDQLSNGRGGSFIVGRTGQKSGTFIRRGVIFFNISSLLNKAFQINDGIDAHTIALQATVRKTGPHPSIIEMYALTTDWGEGDSNSEDAPGQGAPAAPGDATWLFAKYNTTPWVTPGGDFVESPVAIQNVSEYSSYEWSSPQLLIQVINLRNQANRNHGWLLKARDESVIGNAKEFYGRQCSSGALKPRLILRFSGPPPPWFWYVIGIVSAVVLVVLVFFAVYFYQKSSDKDVYQYSTIRDFSVLTAPPDLETLFNDPAIRIVDMGDLTLGRVIGTGAFGAVFEATLKDGSRVALKKVSFDSNQEEEDLFAFAEEIKIMSSIAHPNLLSLFGISFSSNFTDVVLLTDLIENGSLADNLFKKNIKFKPQKKLVILKEIAFGIHYLHSIRPRIIHRDLKSDNILMTKTYSVKIADFGMSKMIQEQSKILTRSGTPHYMAPECISDGKFSEKSDVYAYGVVVWELIKELRPYPHIQSPLQIMFKVVHEGLQPEVPSDAPTLYQWLISHCTTRDPAERPSFKEILLKLDVMKDSIER